MINYNIRYNGPWEYDKFVLNYYNLWNEILIKEKGLNEIEKQNKFIDIIYHDIVHKNTTADIYRKFTYLV